MFSIKKRFVVRESLIMLMLLGSGSLLIYVDCLKSRYTTVNLGVATKYYSPTILGAIGFVILCLYPFYLLMRLIIWGIKKGFKNRIFFCLLAFLCLFSSGCYDAKKEVISASEAVKIEGLPKTYWTYAITPVTNGNDYRFLSPAEKNSPAESGYLRAVPLKDNIYIVQVKYDNYQNYILMFFKLISAASGKEIRMAFPDTAIEASQYGVSTEVNNFYGTTLVGNRKNIMAFLRAYAKVNFKDVSAEAYKIEGELLRAVNIAKNPLTSNNLSAQNASNSSLPPQNQKQVEAKVEQAEVDIFGKKLSPGKCKALYKEIENDLKNANYCQEDEDCRTLELGGPLIEFGCYHFVNKDADAAPIHKKMFAYSLRCSEIINDCSAAPLPKCVHKKCVYDGKP
ncbi:MAG: hypothetical protein PHQ96_08635 [Candidatus Omnitrophica bacterium]|nr:hypothetical protein [Candidatus Omnitrophota bacterium]